MNKPIKNIFPAIGLFFLYFFTACVPADDFNQAVSFPQNQWHQEQAASFVFDKPLPGLFYDISFSITHGRAYPFSNIWLFVEIQAPNGNIQRDTVEYLLADEQGKWYGKKMSEQWEYRLFYKPQVAFPEKGAYTFRLIQGMRSPVLADVQLVSLIVNQHTPPEN